MYTYITYILYILHILASFTGEGMYICIRTNLKQSNQFESFSQLESIETQSASQMPRPSLPCKAAPNKRRTLLFERRSSAHTPPSCLERARIHINSSGL